ncbi:hypothetical protein FD14_GL000302 [Secundilactobacillus similis DSM 23365 = JCM 2765]|uniref:Uncharacterized protein n=1 Tax=Secundilactobacillus similis DSM 23365 = JCM 2765 TaxID=1423804 RepID=A0A0R2FAM7_9LACO|nr:hypothetical protein FD14_GL000302 [Secundilactobacillus similis DSM 23365 = JCM 2765]
MTGFGANLRFGFVTDFNKNRLSVIKVCAVIKIAIAFTTFWLTIAKALFNQPHRLN